MYWKSVLGTYYLERCCMLVNNCSKVIFYRVYISLLKAVRCCLLIMYCSTIIVYITKTCLYNIDSLKPHFYIVKLGFTGVCIIFLILLENIDCGYSLEKPHRGGSNEYHNLCFEQKYEKYLNFYLKIFNFSVINFSGCLNRRVFIMDSHTFLHSYHKLLQGILLTCA